MKYIWIAAILFLLMFADHISDRVKALEVENQTLKNRVCVLEMVTKPDSGNSNRNDNGNSSLNSNSNTAIGTERKNPCQK